MRNLKTMILLITMTIGCGTHINPNVRTLINPALSLAPKVRSDFPSNLALVYPQMAKLNQTGILIYPYATGFMVNDADCSFDSGNVIIACKTSKAAKDLEIRTHILTHYQQSVFDIDFAANYRAEQRDYGDANQYEIAARISSCEIHNAIIDIEDVEWRWSKPLADIASDSARVLEDIRESEFKSCFKDEIKKSGRDDLAIGDFQPLQ